MQLGKPKLRTIVVESNGVEIKKKPEDDPRYPEKDEKLKKIQNDALKNLRNRKMSVEIKRKTMKSCTHGWKTTFTKLDAKHAFENGINGNKNKGLEKQGTSLDEGKQRKQSVNGLKLPSIVINDRRRSSTLGCTDDLKDKKQLEKKLSFDSGMKKLRIKCEVWDKDETKDKEENGDEERSESGEYFKHEFVCKDKTESDNSSESGNENSHSNGVYRLCGHISHTRSLSRKKFHSAMKTQNMVDDENGETLQKTTDEEVINGEETQIPISDYYASKVDQFLKRSQPRSSP